MREHLATAAIQLFHSLFLHARSLLNRTRKGAAQPSGMLGALKSGIAFGKALQTSPLHSEHTLTKRLSAFPALQ